MTNYLSFKKNKLPRGVDLYEFIKNCLCEVTILFLNKSNFKFNKFNIFFDEKNPDFSFTTNIIFLIKKNKNNNTIEEISQEFLSFLKNHYLGEIFSKIKLQKNFFLKFVINASFLKLLLNNLLKYKHFLQNDKSIPTHSLKKIISLEFVSANPTGNLHLGHIRNGAIGDVVARSFRILNEKVKRIYYVNDCGKQIEMLVFTVFLNYLVIAKKITKKNLLSYKNNIYLSNDYEEIAKIIYQKNSDKFINAKYNKETVIEKDTFIYFQKKTLHYFLQKIRETLAIFKIKLDKFYYESKIIKNEKKRRLVLSFFKDKQLLYKKDNALWLKTSTFGDDKDRVLIKQDKKPTYLFPDIMYHFKRFNELKKNFNEIKLINFWGVDHHSYKKRLQIALSLLGIDLKINLIEFVVLLDKEKEQGFSKRKGINLDLDLLLNKLDVSAIRYALLELSNQKKIKLDLKFWKTKQKINPLYYLQYAMARAHKLILKAKENKISYFSSSFEINLLTLQKEKTLILKILLFKNTIRTVTTTLKPVFICEYLKELAKLFHAYYQDKKVTIIDSTKKELSRQRLTLVFCIHKVLSSGFELLGIKKVSSL